MIISDSLNKLSIDDCYPEEVREAFRKFKVEKDEEESLLVELNRVISEYKGDKELFFNGVFRYSVAENYFTDKMGQCNGRLLIQEIFIQLMKHLFDDKENESEQVKSISIKEKELFGLQYLGGYVFQKFYKKFRNSKDWQNEFHSGCISILKAGKSDVDEKQTLVNAKNRGGLWFITDVTQKLFENIELLFRDFTKSLKKKIDYEELTSIVLNNPEVKLYFSNIIYDADMQVSEEVSGNLLELIAGLYLRVRCFSYTRDIKEKYKVNKRSSRKQALRSEIKRCSASKNIKKNDSSK